jgi:hypothetical protein
VTDKLTAVFTVEKLAVLQSMRKPTQDQKPALPLHSKALLHGHLVDQPVPPSTCLRHTTSQLLLSHEPTVRQLLKGHNPHLLSFQSQPLHHPRLSRLSSLCRATLRHPRLPTTLFSYLKRIADSSGPMPAASTKLDTIDVNLPPSQPHTRPLQVLIHYISSQH